MRSATLVNTRPRRCVHFFTYLALHRFFRGTKSDILTTREESMRKTITLAIVVVALVLGLYVAFIPREEAAVNAVAPKDWKEYSNDSLGVRFFSPTRLTVAQNGSDSVTISDAPAPAAAVYYLSVVPSTP